jgi:hypothetical protein
MDTVTETLNNVGHTVGATLIVLVLGILTPAVGIRAISVVRAVIGAIIIAVFLFITGMLLIIALLVVGFAMGYQIKDPGLIVELAALLLAGTIAVWLARKCLGWVVEVTKHPVRSAAMIAVSYLAVSLVTGHAAKELRADRLLPQAIELSNSQAHE